MELAAWEAFGTSRGGLGRSTRSQRIQSYLQPKTSLKWQSQTQLARARIA